MKKDTSATTETIRPKLLIVTDSCFARKDGVIRFLREIIPQLRDRFDIHAVVPDSSSHGWTIHHLEKELKITIHSCPIARQISDFFLARPNFGLIKREVCAADIVWLQSYGPLGLVANHYALRYRTPLCYYAHIVEWLVVASVAKELWGGRMWTWGARKFARHMYNQAALIMVPDKETNKEIERIGVRTKKVLIDLGIDHEAFRKKQIAHTEDNKHTAEKNNKQNRNERRDEKITIGYVGRLAPEKNLITLRRAFDLLSKKYGKLHLLLVGDGPEQQKEFLRGNRITITGFVENVANYLNQMDIFVLPSLTETSSLATMEAMACELPIVATKVGYVTEYIEEGFNGTFFEAQDHKGLARKLEKLILNPRLRKKFGKNARKTVLNAPSWKETADKIADVLLRMREERSTR